MPIEKFDFTQVLKLADGMKKNLQEGYNYTIHPESALGRCINATQNICDAYKKKKLTLTNESIELFDKMHLCRVASEAFFTFKNDPQFIKKFRLLFKDKLTVDIPEHSRSRDTLFEYVVALMYNKMDCQVEFAEPDIIVEVLYDNRILKFAIACKVIESQSNLQKELSDAKNQIQKTPTTLSLTKGIIALDISNIYKEEILRQRQFPGEVPLKNLVISKLGNFVEENRTIFEKYKQHKKVLGIFLFGLYTTWIEEHSSPNAVLGVQMYLLPYRSERSPYIAALKYISEKIEKID
jgi:flagellin-specific chaperone FliS